MAKINVEGRSGMSGIVSSGDSRVQETRILEETGIDLQLLAQLDKLQRGEVAILQAEERLFLLVPHIHRQYGETISTPESGDDPLVSVYEASPVAGMEGLHPNHALMSIKSLLRE